MRAYRFRTWFENKMYKVSSFIQQDETTIKFCGYTEDLKLADDFSDNIMQDTGVKDVNGKEVFEGDIVAEQYHRIEGPNYDPISFGFIDNDVEIDATLIGEVVIWPSAGVMINKIITPDDWQFDKEHVVPTKFHVTKSCEVLGNIYENPELLEA